MNDSSDSNLSEEVRQSLGNSLESALQTGVPYTLAKDFQISYTGMLFDVLIATIKAAVGGQIKQNLDVPRDPSPCAVLPHETNRGHYGEMQDIDLRSYLHTNIGLYNRTEQDPHNRRLLDCLTNTTGRYTEPPLVCYQALDFQPEYAVARGALIRMRLLNTLTTSDEAMVQVQEPYKRAIQNCLRELE